MKIYPPSTLNSPCINITTTNMHSNNSYAQLSRKSVDFQVPWFIPFGLACISAMHFASHTASSTVSSRLKGGDSRPANSKHQRGMSNMDLKRPNIAVV